MHNHKAQLAEASVGGPKPDGIVDSRDRGWVCWIGRMVYWFFEWLLRVLVVVVSGGVLGALTGPLVKLMLQGNWGWLDVIIKGGIVGMKYAGLWATAVALVWCLMDARRKRRRFLGIGLACNRGSC